MGVDDQVEQAAVSSLVALDGNCSSEVLLVNSGPVKGRIRLSILSDAAQLDRALLVDPLVSRKTQSLGTVEPVRGFSSSPAHESELAMACVLVGTQPCEYYGVAWVQAGCGVRLAEVDIYVGVAAEAGTLLEEVLAVSASVPGASC
ncbi:MAG: hypothetical protein ABMA25_15865 [Ilumatobacteraceae bacterium]